MWRGGESTRLPLKWPGIESRIVKIQVYKVSLPSPVYSLFKSSTSSHPKKSLTIATS